MSSNSTTEQKEIERLREHVKHAVIGLKRIGQFRYRNGDDPHSLDCALGYRVAYIFGLGSTSAFALCREFGEDPNFDESREREKENAKS